jgi:hypothetical protein
MDAYISKEDFALYYSTDRVRTKQRIRSSFMAAISRKYELQSFEKFKLSAQRARNLRAWVKALTKDRLIIIDEVHNLLSVNYDPVKSASIMSTGLLEPGGIRGINTILLKYLSANAHSTCKMLYLTATPVFDNIAQFGELIKVMNPTALLPKGVTLLEAVEHLRGKVSFFPGTSVNAYPAVEHEDHNVRMRATQDSIINLLIDEDSDDPAKDSFMTNRLNLFARTCGLSFTKMHLIYTKGIPSILRDRHGLRIPVCAHFMVPTIGVILFCDSAPRWRYTSKISLKPFPIHDSLIFYWIISSAFGLAHSASISSSHEEGRSDS